MVHFLGNIDTLRQFMGAAILDFLRFRFRFSEISLSFSFFCNSKFFQKWQKNQTKIVPKKTAGTGPQLTATGIDNTLYTNLQRFVGLGHSNLCLILAWIFRVLSPKCSVAWQWQDFWQKLSSASSEISTAFSGSGANFRTSRRRCHETELNFCWKCQRSQKRKKI